MNKNYLDKVQIVTLNNGNFNKNSLDDFILNKNVTKCWRKVNDRYILADVRYIEDWNLTQRREMAQKVLSAIHGGDIALAAVLDNTVIGFAIVKKNFFGSERQYVDLAEFYVTLPFRRYGIGKMLFKKVCCEAKNIGAKKLYISAHSAEESISAYKKYGCVFAQEIDKAHVEKEPCDLQLEYDLTARIYQVENKEKYMVLLLLADEQRDMVEKYLNDSVMYVIDDCGVKGEITVTDATSGILEIKNLAIYKDFQRQGYGRRLVEFVCEKYKGLYTALQVGTGDSPLTLPFYQSCGFKISHTVKDFFVNSYDRPIIEEGVQLKDMIYLIKNL